MVLMMDGRVLAMLMSVSITEGRVDWTELSVHMTLGGLGGLSWSSRTPTWRSRSAMVKLKSGSYLGSGVPGRSPSLLPFGLKFWLGTDLAEPIDTFELVS